MAQVENHELLTGIQHLAQILWSNTGLVEFAQELPLADVLDADIAEYQDQACFEHNRPNSRTKMRAGYRNVTDQQEHKNPDGRAGSIVQEKALPADVVQSGNSGNDVRESRQPLGEEQCSP